jgi:hypothetical protein
MGKMGKKMKHHGTGLWYLNRQRVNEAVSNATKKTFYGGNSPK